MYIYDDENIHKIGGSFGGREEREMGLYWVGERRMKM